MKTLRSLTPDDIHILEKNGCRCVNWNNVRVANDFDASFYHHVQFSGQVTLGTADVNHNGGAAALPGIRNAVLHNCSVGNNVSIHNIRGVLANYDIGDNVTIEDVAAIRIDGRTSFGNGVPVNALSEAGHRQLSIFRGLSPQLAYILVTQRHRPQLTEALQSIIAAETERRISERGAIGEGVEIRHCGEIRNVTIGSGATISGALKLENGTIDSSHALPVTIGAGVWAQDFIFSDGAVIKSGATIAKSLISNFSLGMQCSAQDCLMFGPGTFHQGEAKSVFAGPLSTSGHKSTLLIAVMLSFYNAGSGTNQSNHKYKLGALHHGILERGCKTGSGAYMLWPTHVAPFTTILGKHPRHIDASAFPFSLLIEDEAGSRLIPAWNLGNIGLWRDELKRRSTLANTPAHGRITIGLLTPFTIFRINEALTRLRKMARTGKEQINGFFIKGSSVMRAIELYEAAIASYIAQTVIRQFESKPQSLMDSAPISADEKWVDAAGMLMPRSVYQALLDQIENGHIGSLEAIERRLDQIYEAYSENEWRFFQSILAARTAPQANKINPVQLAHLLESCANHISQLGRIVIEDGAKEYDEPCHFGFGIDGDRESDFASVRGSIKENDYVMQIDKEFQALAASAKSVATKLAR